MAVCKFCGAEARLLKEENGVKHYNCVFCGSSYEEVSERANGTFVGVTDDKRDEKKHFSGEEI